MLCCSVLLTTLQLATAQGHQCLQAAGPVSATAASPLLGPWPPLPRYPLKQVQQRLLQLPASNKPWQQSTKKWNNFSCCRCSTRNGAGCRQLHALLLLALLLPRQRLLQIMLQQEGCWGQ
jgi:hypothetical protein